MGENDSEDPGYLARIERVRCLNCSAPYVKPAGGGTVSANPGCPECGYVGWVREQMPITPVGEPNRFFSGRLRRRTG
jgi:hypothetical protein